MVRRFSEILGRWGYNLQAYLILVDCAAHRQTITDHQITEEVDDHRLSVSRRHLERIALFCDYHELPPLIRQVVNETKGEPGEGYFNFDTLYEDRELVHAYPWSDFAPPTITDLQLDQ